MAASRMTGSCVSQFNPNSMTDRLKAATEARAAALARFRDRPAADDPVVLARKAERAQIAREREIRVAAREQARLEARLDRFGDARDATEIWGRLGVNDPDAVPGLTTEGFDALLDSLPEGSHHAR